MLYHIISYYSSKKRRYRIYEILLSQREHQRCHVYGTHLALAGKTLTGNLPPDASSYHDSGTSASADGADGERAQSSNETAPMAPRHGLQLRGHVADLLRARTVARRRAGRRTTRRGPWPGGAPATSAAASPRTRGAAATARARNLASSGTTPWRTLLACWPG